MMNYKQLLTSIADKSIELNTDFQTLFQMYFFERLLFRISKSPYKHNFILKGGLLLSAIIGRKRRTTNDMDTLIKNIELESQYLLNILEQICNMDCDDGITFQIIATKRIRVEDIYGGLNISLLAKKEQLVIPLSIDVTTKDPVTPHEIEFGYKCLLCEENINIMAFTKETIIAEKFQILMEKVEKTNRVKDFFDLYILVTEQWDDINEEMLKIAITNTFRRRNTLYILDDIDFRLQIIQNSNILANAWINFQNSNLHAQDINYLDILEVIKKIANTLSKNEKKRKLENINEIEAKTNK